MSTSSAAGGAPDFNMDAAVVRLLALASNKRAARQRPSTEMDDFDEASPFVLCRITDFPEPSAELLQANEALRAFADELVRIGGRKLMVDVYDEVAERHGYRAVVGVSAAWDGCNGWFH